QRSLAASHTTNDAERVPAVAPEDQPEPAATGRIPFLSARAHSNANKGGDAAVNSVSCVPAGSCAADGYYRAAQDWPKPSWLTAVSRPAPTDNAIRAPPKRSGSFARRLSGQLLPAVLKLPVGRSSI